MKPAEQKLEIESLTTRIIELEKVLANYAPELYKVDWDKAPHWAEYHAFDKNGSGWWFGCYIPDDEDFFDSVEESGYKIDFHIMDQHEIIWKKSKTRNPYIF